MITRGVGRFTPSASARAGTARARPKRSSKMATQGPVTPAAGFQGVIGSVPLADLLQVWGVNRVSGLVTVTSEGRTGRLYLVEGEVVHAEADGVAGEPAVGVILGWPEGSFELAPNTTSLERTIQKSLSHLLLDAHRELDEARRAGATPPPAPASREAPRPGVLDQIRAIPGVGALVRFGKDGRPLGDGGPEAEALAARGLYLAMRHAGAIAAAFGLNELRIASLDSPRGSLVVVHGSGSSLCVAVSAGTPLEPVVAQLRAILARPAPR